LYSGALPFNPHRPQCLPRVGEIGDNGRAVELELLVAELFRSHGYEARHNIWLRGRSGVKHQIDVYAEYRAPLHTDRIIVECKAYERPVDKDRVMKLAQIVQDLGAEKGILVTTSRFTSAAEATARGLNIDLWDCATLARMLSRDSVKIAAQTPGSMVRHLQPVISEEAAASEARRSLGALFPPRVKACILLFHPIYVKTYTKPVERRIGLLSKNSVVEIEEEVVMIDGLTGSQHVCREEGDAWIGGAACTEPQKAWARGAPPYGLLLRTRQEFAEAGSLLYYPYYACILERKGRSYLVAVDGFTGRPDPEASKLYVQGEAYKEIMDEAMRLGLLEI
jgi:hypothetical protein